MSNSLTLKNVVGMHTKPDGVTSFTLKPQEATETGSVKTNLDFFNFKKKLFENMVGSFYSTGDLTVGTRIGTSQMYVEFDTVKVIHGYMRQTILIDPSTTTAHWHHCDLMHPYITHDKDFNIITFTGQQYTVTNSGKAPIKVSQRYYASDETPHLAKPVYINPGQTKLI